MKESELARYFIEYLSDFDLYYEVPLHGRIVDIIGYKKPLLISVEVKTSFSMAVIEQAYNNFPSFNYSYIAVPYRRSSQKMAENYCRLLGIGVLYRYNGIDKWNSSYGEREIREVVKPKLNRKRWGKVLESLNSYQKLSIPGSINDRITPFKNTINQIINYLRSNDGCELNKVYKEIDSHYGNLSCFKSAMYNWISRGVIDEFYIDKGKVYLCQQ